MAAVPHVADEGGGTPHYALNRDHPFVDGNKRFAVAAMETFLFANGAELVALDGEVTGFAMAVARDEITADECAEFLDRRVIRFRWSGSYRALRLSRLADYDLQQMSRTLDEWNQSGTHRFVRILRAMEDIRANVDG